MKLGMFFSGVLANTLIIFIVIVVTSLLQDNQIISETTATCINYGVGISLFGFLAWSAE